MFNKIFRVFGDDDSARSLSRTGKQGWSGRTIAETASFLCRDVYEMRAKIKELRLTEQPSKRRVVL